MRNLLKECIPNDHCKQTNALQIVKGLLSEHKLKEVMDLGCGRGETRPFFLDIDSKIRWVGVDIEHSPEVDDRKEEGGEFETYDGVNIPFEDDSFDLIFTRQAFEHVQYPHDLVKDVARVLKPDGFFVGSTSQLEPFHSFSTFGYTPYGWKFLMEDVAGLKLIEIRPGVDTLTLIIRRALHARRLTERWFDHESPFNRIITLMGKIRRRPASRINAMKLRFAGQFSFIAQKQS